jgi:hypothetical protein
MQLLIQSSAELVAGIGTLFATLLLARFTINRVKQLPDEEKALGKPLWVAVIAIFLLGIGSILYFMLGVELGATQTLYYIVVIIGGGTLALSATMIMGWKRGQALPLVTMAILLIISIVGYLSPGIFGEYTLLLVTSFGLFLFGVPIVLFTYLTITTKRITSFGFAILSITQLALLTITSSTDPMMFAVIIAFRVYGPAVLITALILSETGITGELMMYALTIGSAFYFIAYLLISPVTADVVMTLTIGLVGIGSTIGIGSAAYTLSRWKVSKNPATLSLGLYFLFAGFSFLILALSNIEFVAGIHTDYLARTLGIISSMFLNLSAIIALDWKRVILLPILIAAAPLAQIIMNWPLGIAVGDIPLHGMVMGMTSLFQYFIPLALYAMLWWRMRKEGAPGLYRPLFLSLGIVLLVMGTTGGNLVSLTSSMGLFASFIVFWFGVTGRADKILGKTKAEVTAEAIPEAEVTTEAEETPVEETTEDTIE